MLVLDFLYKGGLLKLHRMLMLEGGCVSVCVCLFLFHIQEIKSKVGPVTFVSCAGFLIF